MKAWIHHFTERLIWRLISGPIRGAVNWTNDEAKVFDSFCQSSCGKKFLELLRQTAAGTTFQAVYQSQTVSANGRARGMQDLLALIHRLRAFPPEESEYAGEDVEPVPSQRNAIDGRRFNLSGGNSAI
jgi:hypothetical protein